MAEWDRTPTDPVNLHGTALKRYGYLLSCDNGEAEDLVQDASVRAFACPGISTSPRSSSYVRKVMPNLFLDRVRRRRVWERLMPLAVPAVQRDDHHRAELRGDLRRALLTLSPHQRACLVMYYYPDMSVPGISQQLGRSAGTVKRHLYHGTPPARRTSETS